MKQSIWAILCSSQDSNACRCCCLATQSSLTLCDPMDCSPPGSSVHGIFQARILARVAIFLLQVIFPTQESNPSLLCLLHCRWILYLLSIREAPLECLVLPSGSAVRNLPETQETCKRYGFNPWIGKSPWRRKWNPTAVCLPGNPQGQRSLAGYSSWGHKEWYTSE